MSRRPLLTALAAVALSWAACYQDDASVTAPPAVRPQITVRLTDAPFPYDSLHSVNIDVVRIEASAAQDTSGGGEWVVITEPRKTFDLLALQQGTTALLGAGEMPAGQYHAVRMTIDTAQSAITWNDAAQTPAQVNWHGLSKIYAFIEYPVSVVTQGADIVLDFDIGRSFQYRYYGTNAFDFMPNLRAINSAAAGAIAGTVTQGSGGTSAVANAQVSVFAPYPGQPDSLGYLEATGRSDSSGRYHVGFLPPGRYFVRIEEPFIPSLEAVVTPNVQVSAGQTTPLSVTLPQAGGGHAYIHISGPTQVGVGGTIFLYAAVGDANGNPVYTNAVTWTSSDSMVAAVPAVDTNSVYVSGRRPGSATIRATSDTLTDSITVQVVALGTLASVSIVPANATVTVGDSGVFLQAVFRDSAGHPLGGYASWFSSDTTKVFVYPCGSCSGDRALGRAPGTATVFATSQGKTGQATITVGPPAPVATVTVVPGSATLTGGDDATFTAELRDAAGNILSNRSVSWSSTDNSVVTITSANGPSATILAQAAGLASLRATSEGKTGEASISVAAPAPVATVTVVPDTATLAVGDSARFFRADLRDAAGNLLRNRTVSWSTSDPSVISVSGSGAQALVQPRAVGSAFLRATSEGKTGQATITVH